MDAYGVGMQHLLGATSADAGRARRVWALLLGRYRADVRAAMRCEVLLVERETFTLRARGAAKIGSAALDPLLRDCPDTLRSYEIDGGADDRGTRGLDVHLVLQRYRSGGTGGGAASSGEPRKRAAPAASESESSSGDEAGHVRRRGAKSRPVGGEVPVSADVPPLTLRIERPVALQRAVTEAVDRDDRPSVLALTNAVCNADRNMPRVELTVIPRADAYLLVYAGARLLSWPFVRYVRARHPAVADIELTVRTPEQLARKLLGAESAPEEVAELAEEWADTRGADGMLCALVVTLTRATAFAGAA